MLIRIGFLIFNLKPQSTADSESRGVRDVEMRSRKRSRGRRDGLSEDVEGNGKRSEHPLVSLSHRAPQKARSPMRRDVPLTKYLRLITPTFNVNPSFVVMQRSRGIREINTMLIVLTRCDMKCEEVLVETHNKNLM